MNEWISVVLTFTSNKAAEEFVEMLDFQISWLTSWRAEKTCYHSQESNERYEILSSFKMINLTWREKNLKLDWNAAYATGQTYMKNLCPFNLHVFSVRQLYFQISIFQFSIDMFIEKLNYVICVGDEAKSSMIQVYFSKYKI